MFIAIAHVAQIAAATCPAACGQSTPVSVRSCGALGDGVADDTAAIVCAIGAATKHHAHVAVHGQRTEDSVADVHFPAGAYRISQTISLGPQPPRLHGEGNAIVHMTDAAADVFVGTAVTNWRCSDIAIVGGRDQLRISNNNNDRSIMLIERVTFHNASGAAIRTAGPSSPAARGSFSTKVTVRDCVFYYCVQALINWADWTSVEGGWVTTSPLMHDKAVFENWDRLWLRDILGVPGAAYSRGANARWIDNNAYRLSGGWVNAKDVRFGDELGCAMAAVVNFAPSLCVPVKSAYDEDVLCARPPRSGANLSSLVSGWSSVVIEGGYLCAANAANTTDIHLEEIPNQLVVRSTMAMTNDASAKPVLVGVAAAIDLDGPLLAHAQAQRPDRLQIDIDGVWNDGGAYLALPQQLWPYVVPERRVVTADAPPTRGVWRAGQRVWRRPGSAVDPLLLGWVCTGTGWANISAAGF